MKARHVIMIIVLILVATIVFSLKEEKNTKTLTCSVNNDFQGMDSVTTLKVKVKDSEIKDIDMTIDAKLPKEYQNQKQNIIDSMNAQGKMHASSTSDGIRLEADMRSDYFKSLGLNTKASYQEFKQALEFQGYRCKN